MAEMYTSGAWVTKVGEEEEFVRAWTEFAQWASEQPGAGALRLTRDFDQERRYFSFAPWESRDAAHAWKQTPEFAERMKRVQAHVEQFSPAELELVTTVQAGAPTPA